MLGVAAVLAVGAAAALAVWWDERPARAPADPAKVAAFIASREAKP